MKKLLSIILSFAILTGLFAGLMPLASAKTKTSLYRKPVKSALAGVNEYGESSGFLYDFNKDGKKELIMTYTDNASLPVYYAVYTIRGNKVKKLCKNKVLTSFGGNCFRGVGVAKKGGKRYLVTFVDFGTSDISYNAYKGVYVNYYKVTKTKIKKVKAVSFQGDYNNAVQPVKMNKRSCKINGKKVSFRKYKKTLKSFSYSRIKKKYDPYWKYQTLRTKRIKTLKGLYNTL